MKKTPWAMLGFVVVFTALLLTIQSGRGAAGALVGVIAALATCVGALCAPASYSGGPLGEAEGRRRKSIQICSAGLVTVIIAGVFDMREGVAAIFGIVAAMLVGAVLPRCSVAPREREGANGAAEM